MADGVDHVEAEVVDAGVVVQEVDVAGAVEGASKRTCDLELTKLLNLEQMSLNTIRGENGDRLRKGRTAPLGGNLDDTTNNSKNAAGPCNKE